MFPTIKMTVGRDEESYQDMVEALLILPKSKKKILLESIESDTDIQEFEKFEKSYRDLANIEGFNFTFDKNYGILRQDFLPEQEKNPFRLTTDIPSLSADSHVC